MTQFKIKQTRCQASRSCQSVFVCFLSFLIDSEVIHNFDS